MLQAAAHVVVRDQNCAVKYLKRIFQIGFRRAAEVVEELEKFGIVGPIEGNGKRKILLSDEQVARLFGGLPTGGGATVPAAPPVHPGADGSPAIPSAAAESATRASSSPGDGPPSGGGDEPPMPTGEEPDLPEDDSGHVHEVLEAFYKRLTLSDADVDQLWIRRALTRGTCRMLRSNPKENREIIESLADQFPMTALVESGLWKSEYGHEPKPNPQFCGWGITGRKKKSDAESEGGDFEWGWSNPVLIPYFDDLGKLTGLRPHKGMMKGKSAQLYIPFPDLENQKEFETAIICEGEFKALAVLQALGELRNHNTGRPAFGVCSLPGISLSKRQGGGWWIRDALEKWLRASGARQVVVAFDNEEKGDPKLPAYKPDEWKRFETQAWARYLADQLMRENYDARVLVLPKEWRDENGKADWDGALMLLAKKFGATNPEDWDRVRERVSRTFVDALKKALPSSRFWQMGLFSPQEEMIIARRVKVISYEPKLAAAGEKEKWLVGKLTEFIWDCRRALKQGRARISDVALGYLEWLCRKYRALDMIPYAKGERHGGGYYILQPLPSKKSKVDPEENYRENWLQRQEGATNLRDFDYKWACEIALQGVPDQFTDFFVRPYYILQKENGELRRLVRIYNIHGEKTQLLDLDAESFSAPKPLRVWLNRNANVTWGAGEKELQSLQFDLASALARKRVIEVPYFGWHAPSKLWFFNDVAIGDGIEVMPEKDSGIFWYAGTGYKVGETDHEGENFHQGRPMMHPEQEDKDVWGDGSETNEAAVQSAVQDIGARLCETLGGLEGYLVLGSVCAYAAAPEIYHEFNGFPGLWIHGEQGKGKSSLARWLIQIMGIDRDAGIPLKSSVTGIKIVLQQYSNLPVWFEEAQTTTDPDMLEMIKLSYGRESPVKKSFEQKSRVVRSTPIITGVATSSEPQVRQRFPHVLVSDKKRIENHFTWFQKERRKFFIIGRWLLRHRKAFAAEVIKQYREWIDIPDLGKVEQRTRSVHGVVFSAFVSLTRLLKSHAPSDVDKFRGAMLSICMTSNAQVGDQVDVNRFWSDVLSAFKIGAFGFNRADWRRYFKATRLAESAHPPDVPMGADHNEARCIHCYCPRWASYRLFIAPNAVLDQLAKHLRQQGRELSLKIQDLWAQMTQQKYWVPPKSGRFHKQRFGYGPDAHDKKSATNCWCIDVDQHDMGYTPASENVLRESWKKSESIAVSREDWVDPRKGDLFDIVHAVEPLPEDTNHLV